MTKKVSSPIVPKKGKLRSVQKRPATKKTKAWQAVKYIRENVAVGPRGVRKEQAKWKRTLLQLLMASNKDIVKMLVADRILPNWKNKVCPRCEAGSLSELKLHTPSGQYKHRCSSRACHVWINPHHLHPLFTDGRGTGAQSLQMRSSLLLMILLRVPHPSIHLLLNINHKAIEDMEKRLCELRQVFVEKEEKKIVFGDGKNWKDVEADTWNNIGTYLRVVIVTGQPTKQYFISLSWIHCLSCNR